MSHHVRSEKYELYLSQHATKLKEYTFDDLATYTDQLLATYQEEMLSLRLFREKHINMNDNRQILKKHLNQSIKIENINTTVLSLKDITKDTPKQIFDLYTLASKLHEREVLLNMNVREITVILKRLTYLKERNM